MSVQFSSLARRDPAHALVAATAIGWVVVVGSVVAGGGMPGMAGMAADNITGSDPARALVVLGQFVGGWLVMVAAMMLPSTIPMARAFTVVSRHHPKHTGMGVIFYAAYVLIWLGFGLLGLTAALALHQATHRASPGLVLGAALAIAGAFQLSSLKRRCMTMCRDPRAFLFTHYRRGLAGAWALGIRHGLWCLGCCSALMLVMFAVGAGGLVWMLGLTAVMSAEKATRWGTHLTRPIGIALLVTAALLATTTGNGPDPTTHLHMR